MPKKGLFLEINCENRRSVGGSVPKPPVTYGSWGSALDPGLLFSQSHILLQLRNLKAFVGGHTKIFYPKNRGTLATPQVI